MVTARTRRALVIMITGAAIIAGVISGFGVPASALGSVRSGHTRPAEKTGFWTQSQFGTWMYGAGCQCWTYNDNGAVWDNDSSHVATGGGGVLNMTRAFAVASGPVTAISLDVLGKQSVLTGATAYVLQSGGKSAQLDQRFSAPRGADAVTVTASGGPSSGVQTITFARDGSMLGKSHDVAIGDFVDIAVRRPLIGCADGHAEPPVEVIPTVLNAKPATGGAQETAGFPTLMPCQDTFPRKVKVS